MPRLVAPRLDPSEFVVGNGGDVAVNDCDGADAVADDADDEDDDAVDADGDDDDHTNDEDTDDDDEPIMAFFRRVVQNKTNINLDSIRRRLDNPDEVTPTEETIDAPGDVSAETPSDFEAALDRYTPPSHAHLPRGLLVT